jgi:hypothetical protein
MDVIQNIYKSGILIPMECSFCNSIYSILYKSFTLINMIPCIEQCELIEVVNKGSNSIFSNLNGKKVSNI